MVTGGASGIGAACARRLAQAGAAVLVTDVDQTLGEQVVAQIHEAGGSALFALHDVTDEAQWEKHCRPMPRRFWRHERAGQ